MAFVVTQSVMLFECRCGNQSPPHKYRLAFHRTDEQIRKEINQAISLAKGEDWFVLGTNYSICPSCFEQTLKEIRDIQEVYQ